MKETMMKTKIESIWERLLEEQHNPKSEHKLGKIIRVDETHPFNLYAGIDEEDRFILAVNLKERPQSVQIKSDAFHCFRQRRIDDSWFFVLALEQQALSPVFGKLCQDLIDTSWTIQDEEELERLFVDRLMLWKRLFDLGVDGLLDESKVRGLIGELLIFRSLIDSSEFTTETIAESWVGPLSAPQDFQFVNHSSEVKCISHNKPTVKVSSLEQLDSKVPLKLNIVTLKKSDGSHDKSINLNSLVAEIEGRLNAAALKIFSGRLLEAGYVENPHYDSLEFLVIDSSEYQVSDSFPKLTSMKVDDGIVDATYSISLESIESFRV